MQDEPTFVDIDKRLEDEAQLYHFIENSDSDASIETENTYDWVIVFESREDNGNSEWENQPLLNENDEMTPEEWITQFNNFNLRVAVFPDIENDGVTLTVVCLGIPERVARRWAEHIGYQLPINRANAVEWLAMSKEQLALATLGHRPENAHITHTDWDDVHVRYYYHAPEEIYAEQQIADMATGDGRRLARTLFRPIDRVRLISDRIGTQIQSHEPFMDIRNLKHVPHPPVSEAYPPHDYLMLKDLMEFLLAFVNKFDVRTLNKVPTELLRNYFGEKIALYFLFLSTYTRYLLYICFFGIILQCYQWGMGTVNVPGLGVFGFFFMAWILAVPWVWRRMEWRRAFEWGQTRVKSESGDRPEYEGDFVISNVHGRPTKLFPKEQKRKRYCTTYGILAAVLLGLCGAYFTFLVLSMLSTYSNFPFGSYLMGFLNGACIVVVNHLYDMFAVKLNDYENHRTHEKYEEHLFIKTFVFRCVNSYVVLYYIAFLLPLTQKGQFLHCAEAGCLHDLQVYFGGLFFTLCTFQLVYEVFNLWKGKWSKINLLLDFEYDVEKQMKKEYSAFDYRDIGRRLDDFIIQYGFVAIFGLVWPMCAFIAVIYNLCLQKLEMYKLLCICRRPYPYPAKDMVAWDRALRVLSWIAICTNLVYLCLLSRQLIVQASPNHSLNAVISYLCLLMLWVVLVSFAYWQRPSVPVKIRGAMKRQYYIDRAVGIEQQVVRDELKAMPESHLLRWKEWEVDEVAYFIQSCGHSRFSKYADSFSAAQVDGKMLCRVTPQDLNRIGVRDELHQQWIMDLLHELSKQATRIENLERHLQLDQHHQRTDFDRMPSHEIRAMAKEIEESNLGQGATMTTTVTTETTVERVRGDGREAGTIDTGGYDSVNVGFIPVGQHGFHLNDMADTLNRLPVKSKEKLWESVDKTKKYELEYEGCIALLYTAVVVHVTFQDRSAPRPQQQDVRQFLEPLVGWILRNPARNRTITKEDFFDQLHHWIRDFVTSQATVSDVTSRQSATAAFNPRYEIPKQPKPRSRDRDSSSLIEGRSGTQRTGTDGSSIVFKPVIWNDPEIYIDQFADFMDTLSMSEKENLWTRLKNDSDSMPSNRLGLWVRGSAAICVIRLSPDSRPRPNISELDTFIQPITEWLITNKYPVPQPISRHDVFSNFPTWLREMSGSLE